jgi:(3R)-3-hydroxyacyl-CoA dehydrogenase / 3a,7a,12a-trihydroxy-5b-cholest-24-enoyl-CoA hydratase / enoyl-CoA hydratase 2
MIRLDGRVAIVTGAGGGLGRAHARELARRGAAVVVNDVANADGVVDEIRAAGGAAVADTSSVLDGASLVATALASYGDVHVLVNNAGILRDAAFHKMDLATFDDVLDVHLRGAVAVSMAAFRHMREHGYGRIVMTTSSAGLLGNFGQANYGAAKAGLYGLTRVLALEGAAKGVHTNAVMPIAATPMTEAGMTPEMREALSPDLVSPVVAFLASEQCELNGEVLNAAGGSVSRFFLGLTRGWGSSALTAEDVADHLDEIVREDGYSVPSNAGEASRALMAQLPLPATGSPLVPGGVDTSLFGRQLAPTTFHVDRDQVRRYAAATADDNPAYDDATVAPAAFAFPVVHEAVGAAVRTLVAPHLMMRIVHGAHDIYVRRPLVPGTTLTTVAQPWGLRTHGSAARLCLRLVSTDSDGEVVLEQFGQFAIRGVTDLPDVGFAPPPFRLPDDVATSRPVGRRTTKVTADQPTVYAEASGDHSPIHVDADAARAAGLPGVILQGMCAFAMSVAAATDEVAGGDPRAVARAAVRFSAPVLPGSELETAVHLLPDQGLPGRTTYGFRTTCGDSVVLKDGVLEVFGR